MTNRMKNIVNMQVRENRKPFDTAVSRGYANNSPVKINFIFAAVLTALKKTVRLLGPTPVQLYVCSRIRWGNLQDYALFGLQP